MDKIMVACFLLTDSVYRFERLPVRSDAPNEQTISAVGGGTPTVFGMDVPT